MACDESCGCEGEAAARLPVWWTAHPNASDHRELYVYGQQLPETIVSYDPAGGTSRLSAISDGMLTVGDRMAPERLAELRERVASTHPGTTDGNCGWCAMRDVLAELDAVTAEQDKDKARLDFLDTCDHRALTSIFGMVGDGNAVRGQIDREMNELRGEPHTRNPTRDDDVWAEAHVGESADAGYGATTMRPALTEREWAKVQGAQLAVVKCHVTPDEIHRQVALANHALPEGDARKITREDVEVLESVATLVEDLKYFESGRPHLVRALAAKLNALLPPTSRAPDGVG